jgi:hypothetical protein
MSSLYFYFQRIIFIRHSRAGGCVAIVETTHSPILVIPGLIRNPVSFQIVQLLDAGRVTAKLKSEDGSGLPST